jgi:hypothetical protein
LGCVLQLLGAARTNAARWKKAEALITRSNGKPSVAKSDDKRPAISVTATAADFADLASEQ